MRAMGRTFEKSEATTTSPTPKTSTPTPEMLTLIDVRSVTRSRACSAPSDPRHQSCSEGRRVLKDEPRDA